MRFAHGKFYGSFEARRQVRQFGLAGTGTVGICPIETDKEGTLEDLLGREEVSGAHRSTDR